MPGDTEMIKRCVINEEPMLGGFILWVASTGQVGFYAKEKDAKKYAKEITEALEKAYEEGRNG